MTNSPYRLLRPHRRTSPVVFASPHSGRTYPEEMLRQSVLDPLQLRSSEDAFVDRLFSDVPKHGVAFLAAEYPRAWLDLNRRHDELDPALILDVPRVGMNPRVASGLGVIPRVVAGGRSIYRGKITRAAAQDRIDKIWTPYHRMLKSLLEETRAQFGEAILIDCHSMPREALVGLGSVKGGRPEIILGDRYGSAAAPAVTRAVESAFRAQGFTVARNIPFAGAYITQQYGRPSSNTHVVQVEIDRSLYMNEKTLEPRADFEGFRMRINAAAAMVAKIGRDRQPLAAE
ncbi:N-formylglutamate amidohydrolase [Celeribacter litoreus]|uniref:N-formylglutamate amidohydrolase n=1 Tax=Celeribacter litoreus TaxID=2876714 RepID=UPI001CCC5A5B|nr:N-formylglutamate amidohydrolase [Celeribacter litoreus]MCA0041876.1 N-formylglutamate amidohydrolase [Celeribacter litoreus]